jgi:hypothetical protein
MGISPGVTTPSPPEKVPTREVASPGAISVGDAVKEVIMGSVWAGVTAAMGGEEWLLVVHPAINRAAISAYRILFLILHLLEHFPGFSLCLQCDIGPLKRQDSLPVLSEYEILKSLFSSWISEFLFRSSQDEFFLSIYPNPSPLGGKLGDIKSEFIYIHARLIANFPESKIQTPGI